MSMVFSSYFNILSSATISCLKKDEGANFSSAAEHQFPKLTILYTWVFIKYCKQKIPEAYASGIFLYKGLHAF